MKMCSVHLVSACGFWFEKMSVEGSRQPGTITGVTYIRGVQRQAVFSTRSFIGLTEELIRTKLFRPVSVFLSHDWTTFNKDKCHILHNLATAIEDNGGRAFVDDVVLRDNDDLPVAIGDEAVLCDITVAMLSPSYLCKLEDPRVWPFFPNRD